MSNVDDLNTLKVGDEVLEHFGYGNRAPQILQVTKVTKTQIHTRYRKFRIRDGFLVGGDKWSSIYITVPSDEDIVAVREQTDRADLLNKLRHIDWTTLNIHQLRHVHAVATDELKVGSTNDDEPFKPGEYIEWGDNKYVVVSNDGSKGEVREVWNDGTEGMIIGFMWRFDGVVARRTTR